MVIAVVGIAPHHTMNTYHSTDRARANAAMCRYARGDERAFAELHQLLAPRLLRLCASLAGKIDAEELAQEVFLKLHRGRANFVEGGSVIAWAFTIARTTAVDRARRRMRRREDTVGPELLDARAPRIASTPEQSLVERSLEFALEGQLAHLSDALRSAYVMVRCEGLTCAETGAALGVSKAAVKQRVHRASEEIKVGLATAGW